MEIFILVIFFLIGLFIAIQRLTAKPSIREIKHRINEHEHAIREHEKAIREYKILIHEKHERSNNNNC